MKVIKAHDKSLRFAAMHQIFYEALDGLNKASSGRLEFSGKQLFLLCYNCPLIWSCDSLIFMMLRNRKDQLHYRNLFCIKMR